MNPPQPIPTFPLKQLLINLLVWASLFFEGLFLFPTSWGQSLPKRDLYGDPLPKGALARIGTVRFRHGRELRCLAFSHESRLLATSGADHTVSIWDVANGKEQHRFDTPGAYIAADDLAFSPDGQVLAIAMEELQIRDVETGKLVFRSKDNRRHKKVAFAADGKTALTFGYIYLSGDKFIKVWDVGTWNEVRAFTIPRSVEKVAFSPDGRKVAVVVKDTVYIWDANTGQKVRSLPKHYSPIRELAFSPDSRHLVACDASYEAFRVWDTRTGKQQFEVRTSHFQVYFLGFTPDGKKIIAAGYDGSVRLWDRQAGKQVRQFPIIRNSRGPFALSPDGKWLAGSEGLRFWDVSTGREKNIGGDCGQKVYFFRDGKRVAVGPHVHVADVKTGKVLHSFPEPDFEQHSEFSFFHDTVLRYSHKDKKFLIHDALAKKLLTKMSLPNPPLRWGLQLSPDLKRYLWWTSKKNLLGTNPSLGLYDSVSGKKWQEWTAPANGEFTGYSFSRDGQRLLAVLAEKKQNVRAHFIAHRDLSVAVWNTRTGDLILHLPPEKIGFAIMNPVSQLTPDNRFLSVLTSERTLLIHETISGKLVKRISFSPKEYSGQFALSDDGRILAVAFYQPYNYVCLYHVATGQKLQTYTGHRGYISSLAFSRDGSKLASAALDQTTLIWPVPPLPDPKVKLSPKQWPNLWKDLGREDAGKGFQVHWQLVGYGDEVVPFLDKYLQPPIPVSDDKIAQLVKDLGSGQFVVRTKAESELAQMGKLAESALKKGLQKNPSLEVQLRIEKLLAQLDPISLRDLRFVRAVSVLEHIGTAAARKVLERVAKDSFSERVVDETRETLVRMDMFPP